MARSSDSEERVRCCSASLPEWQCSAGQEQSAGDWGGAESCSQDCSEDAARTDTVGRCTETNAGQMITCVHTCTCIYIGVHVHVHLLQQHVHVYTVHVNGHRALLLVCLAFFGCTVQYCGTHACTQCTHTYCIMYNTEQSSSAYPLYMYVYNHMYYGSDVQVHVTLCTYTFVYMYIANVYVHVHRFSCIYMENNIMCIAH